MWIVIENGDALNVSQANQLTIREASRFLETKKSQDGYEYNIHKKAFCVSVDFGNLNLEKAPVLKRFDNIDDAKKFVSELVNKLNNENHSSD